MTGRFSGGRGASSRPYWWLGEGAIVVVAILTGLGLTSCDTSISGTPIDNMPPETALSVRDASLIDNLGGIRLTSTVDVSWSGTDADGFVTGFEIRYFADEDVSQIGPDDGWVMTTALDTLILLPIKAGSSQANVVFEVRAIDNKEVRDPTPARTVYPIQNAPPDILLKGFELPPEETFTVFSFGWTARDPEGPENLAGIDVSFNDSTQFVRLAPDVEFATFVAQLDDADPARARVYTGRGFQSTAVYVPGVKLDAENTFYIRAVDQTDTTSALRSFTWKVRRPTSEVLFVNDYRKSFAPQVQSYHTEILRSFLPVGMPIDVWDLSMPFLSGSTGESFRSGALPSVADPTIRQTLALFKYVYWVSTNTTNSITGNNLPLVASVTDRFFENGGKMVVHTPISLPNIEEENEGNPAILLMPLSGLVSFPDSLRASLRLPNNGEIAPVGQLPGLERPLPALLSNALLISTLPYEVGGTDIPLYRAEYRYVTRGGAQGPWTGAATVASISADRRIALMAIPLADERTGLDLFRGVSPSEGPREAMFMILESLGFPKR